MSDTENRERIVRAACAYVAASNAFLARDADHVDVLYWERDNKYRELEGAVDAFWKAHP